MSTGAHSPSLISQGRIGQLVTAKPIERRSILEEAAGISGIHARRQEAETRLNAAENNLKFNLATIYADVSVERAQKAVKQREIQRFEASFPLTSEVLDETVSLVAQMGHEPIVEALRQGAQVIIAGRAVDDCAIAAFPIWQGADPAQSIHMGKVLECGAFSAEPFAMDVMIGVVDDNYFVLEPGSLDRRASLESVAAHSLYERENPYIQGGPGHHLDLHHLHQ